MPGTYFYIDGLNFYYGAVQGTPHKWVDFEALARAIAPNDQIDCIRYFTARVKPGFPGDNSHQRQDVFLRAIATNPIIDIKLGHFRSDPKWRPLVQARATPAEDLFRPALRPPADVRAIFAEAETRRTLPMTMAYVKVNEEKGSDVNLGAWLMEDAFRGRSAKAVVITNDSDLETPIRMTVAYGVPVIVVNPRAKGVAKELKKVATGTINLKHRVLPACQLPDPVVRPGRSPVHKPPGW